MFTTAALLPVTLTATPASAATACTATYTPAPGSSSVAETTIQLVATAGDSDGTVTKVEFYDDTSLLATDPTSPYTAAFTPTAAGSHSLTARVCDDMGASTTSAPVGITVTPGPSVVVSPATVDVVAGNTATFTVALSQAPSGDVTVSTARTGGSTSVTVSGGTSLTFTTANWNTPAQVTVASAANGTWAKILTRQLELYQWLQSSEGAIAGGVTNSWQGAYYGAKANNATAKTLAKQLLDAMRTAHQDPQGISVPETRDDYKRFNDKVYIPSGWTGKMPNGDTIDSSSTFLSLRSWYKNDPNWAKVQTYLNGGSAPTFRYHRFWAQADVATAFAVYAELIGS